MKKLGIVFATLILALMMSGCSNSGEIQQVQPQESKVVYVKPTNISGALINNTVRNLQYNLDAEDAQRVYNALEGLTITDNAKYDTKFFNQITFYSQNKKQVVTISSVRPRDAISFGYQLLLDNGDGKVFTSKEFYRELQDLELINKFMLGEKYGG